MFKLIIIVVLYLNIIQSSIISVNPSSCYNLKIYQTTKLDIEVISINHSLFTVVLVKDYNDSLCELRIDYDNLFKDKCDNVTFCDTNVKGLDCSSNYKLYIINNNPLEKETYKYLIDVDEHPFVNPICFILAIVFLLWIR